MKIMLKKLGLDDALPSGKYAGQKIGELLAKRDSEILSYLEWSKASYLMFDEEVLDGISNVRVLIRRGLSTPQREERQPLRQEDLDRLDALLSTRQFSVGTVWTATPPPTTFSGEYLSYFWSVVGTDNR